MLFDYDGSGERNIVASPYTLMLYEQTFKSSLIKDFYGVIDLSSGSKTEVVTADFVANRLEEANGKKLSKTVSDLVNKAFPAEVMTVLDYTSDNWEQALKALWAMVKTGEKVDISNGKMVADPIPDFNTWLIELGNVNMSEICAAVLQETQHGLFRARSN